MIESVPGSLVMVDLNTHSPSVYWKGQKLEQLSGVRVVDGKVSLTVNPTPLDLLYAELEAAGIKIKKTGG